MPPHDSEAHRWFVEEVLPHKALRVWLCPRFPTLSGAGMTLTRRWTLRFHGQPGPRPVLLDGRPLESRYDAATRTLTCEFSADKGAAHRVRCP